MKSQLVAIMALTAISISSLANSGSADGGFLTFLNGSPVYRQTGFGPYLSGKVLGGTEQKSAPSCDLTLKPDIKLNALLEHHLKSYEPSASAALRLNFLVAAIGDFNHPIGLFDTALLQTVRTIFAELNIAEAAAESGQDYQRSLTMRNEYLRMIDEELYQRKLDANK